MCGRTEAVHKVQEHKQKKFFLLFQRPAEVVPASTEPSEGSIRTSTSASAATGTSVIVKPGTSGSSGAPSVAVQDTPPREAPSGSGEVKAESSVEAVVC